MVISTVASRQLWERRILIFSVPLLEEAGFSLAAGGGCGLNRPFYERCFPVTDDTQQPYWVLLYNDFITQTKAYRMQARLETLELALAERLQELDGHKESHAERLAIKEAYRRLLQLKVEMLGFPPVGVKSTSSNARQT